VDKKSIELALDSEEDNTQLLQYLELSTTTETTEAKIKLKRTS